ncbi:polymerase delta-interacting protein 3-like [Hydractinia symbiolongicarpus]|uniref:polymerase delta-interacting protein 3-like n=1 Tax=Hydractinia symbiolongicarpus TaxID=13093 RepID=UPI00254B19B5|nr:polymerase delta-interacting protein 3-like [Hydractinia symbiolongicarpus]
MAASSNYDLSLDQIINKNRKKSHRNIQNKNAVNNKRNFNGKNNKFVELRTRTKRVNKPNVNDNRRSFPLKGLKRPSLIKNGGKPFHENKKKAIFTAKNRVNNQNIQKVKTGAGEVRLFTKHFDARAKLQAKKQALKSPSAVAKKALQDVRSGQKANIINRKRNLNTPGKNKKSILDRASTFTGSSIKIIAKNKNSVKDRKALVKGNSLSVVTKNKVRNRKRNNKSRRSGGNSSQLNTSTSDDDSYQELYAPEPNFVSPIKKPLPAKVIISNLHHSVSQDDIQELFGAIGIILDAKLKSVGTAEVVYSTAEDAFAAYSKYHGRNLDGQPMILKITTADETQRASTSSSSTKGFMQARSSNRSSQPQQYYTPPPMAAGGGAASNSKPVVFTVKL